MSLVRRLAAAGRPLGSLTSFAGLFTVLLLAAYDAHTPPDYITEFSLVVLNPCKAADNYALPFVSFHSAARADPLYTVYRTYTDLLSETTLKRAPATSAAVPSAQYDCFETLCDEIAVSRIVSILDSPLEEARRSIFISRCLLASENMRNFPIKPALLTDVSAALQDLYAVAHVGGFTPSDEVQQMLEGLEEITKSA